MQIHYEIAVEFEYLKEVKYDELKAIVAQQPLFGYHESLFLNSVKLVV